MSRQPPDPFPGCQTRQPRSFFSPLSNSSARSQILFFLSDTESYALFVRRYILPRQSSVRANQLKSSLFHKQMHSSSFPRHRMKSPFDSPFMVGVLFFSIETVKEVPSSLVRPSPPGDPHSSSSPLFLFFGPQIATTPSHSAVVASRELVSMDVNSFFFPTAFSPKNRG